VKDIDYLLDLDIYRRIILKEYIKKQVERVDWLHPDPDR
jgi:phosphoglycerate-specific signal transduction histidine kinase